MKRADYVKLQASILKKLCDQRKKKQNAVLWNQRLKKQRK